jgi:hypothetical protein
MGVCGCETAFLVELACSIDRARKSINGAIERDQRIAIAVSPPVTGDDPGVSPGG